MKNIILGLVVLIGLVSCTPPPQAAKQSTPLVVDTVPTIELSANTDSVVLVIGNGYVRLLSKQLTTYYTIDAENVRLTVNEVGGIENLIVNNSVLLSRSQSNHTYLYGEDVNTLIVQPGNTISSIVQDHRSMGYNVSTKSIYQCNPFLKSRQLRVGDLIRIECQ